ncbi:sensor histidine kinase [Streptomyces sp. AK02-01A]|uniref:sensor histidine kinase n=1 Tax=Streptomyces sp. AK02-01A TaxID=3028648 RepID=UPI0029B9A9A9|nr:histidine kinase [Streptomyces sp. AK02-01A]MDX3853611.1 histidine kinase [Streptomyces sp. AK02-01A]
MHATPPLPLLKRVPPEVWTAATWCLSTVSLVRGYLGIPGMPQGLPPLTPVDWTLLAAATAMALDGSRLLRRRPLIALALLLAGSLTAALALNSVLLSQVHYLAAGIALGFVVATRPSRTRLVAFVMTLGVVPGYALIRSLLGLPLSYPNDLADGNWTGWLPFSLMAVVAWLIGNSTRQTREYAARLGAQATAQAVTAERLRIARELHDMVAHSIGIIALQAGAAARVIDTQPAGAREAMTAVELAGRETLSGLRRMLGALREADPAQRSEGIPLSPAAGLVDIDRLAAATTAAGVRVEVRWRGERRPLPPEIELSAFRIVQESVANVVRHAGAPSCLVSIDHGDEELSIEVVDSGLGRGASSGAGYGLVGMRERVGLLHGAFTAGPRPEGGFQVTARLPVPAGTR